MQLTLQLKSLFFLFAFGFATTSVAQQTLFNANFNNTTGDNDWFESVGSDDGSWQVGNDFAGFGRNGSYVYLERSYFGVTYEPDERAFILSPTIDLSGHERLNLSFDMYVGTFPANTDGVVLLYSVNGGTFRTFGKENDVAVNWYTTRDIESIGDARGRNSQGQNTNGGWGDNNGWRTCSIDLPPQGFDDNDNVRFAFYFASDDSNWAVNGFAMDNFRITGHDIEVRNYLSCGNGIWDNLDLWLNTESLSGLNDGDRVDVWNNYVALDPASNIDQEWTRATAQGDDRPTFRDNPTDNVNFNPVVSFDGSNSMHGRSGFFSNDLYLVINPKNTISSLRPTEDIFHGDDYVDGIGTEDVTGFSINDTSIRYGASKDIAAYNQGSRTKYGSAIIEADLVYDRPLIFNARLNADGTAMDFFLDGVDLGVSVDPALVQEANLSTFKEILNSRYWLGRSEFFGPSFTGDILEVLSFNTRKSDVHRDRILSHLAMKYGINLGLFPIPQVNIPHVPGTFVKSDGTALWNESLHPGFTYNVSGIGRDDCALFHQKQSKSVDPNSFITVGLQDIATSNKQNPSSFQSDGDFLMWGSTPSTLQPLPAPLEVELGPNVVTTFTDVSERTWKFVEISPSGNDIPSVKLSVDTSGLASLPALTGNDAYVMIVADDEAFTTNIETIFLTTNGIFQECDYDFDGTKFIKFGVAHEVIEPRHIDFDGSTDYVAMGDELDLGNEFTISAWILADGNNVDSSSKTIVTKRGAGNNGYQFYLTSDNRVAMRFTNSQIITSNTILDEGKWRYVAFIYENGVGRIYIDGMLDNQRGMSAPAANSNRFVIGARYIDKNNIANPFKGKIDEIRMFSEAISLDQLKFLMNQELLPDGSGIKGTVIPTSVTLNDIQSLQYANLDAYFNMNTYIGTHLNDASGNRHRGALKSPENFVIETQTAPLPYIAVTNGNWNNNDRWLNGDELYIPGSPRTVNGVTATVDWNIVLTDRNLNITDRDVTLLGLEMTNRRLRVRNAHGLTITHHLLLDAFLDLEDESQLVQTTDSDLIVGADARLDRDQQGTVVGYDYNYWSSPVSSSSTGSNGTFTLRDVLRDGTDPSSPQSLNYTGTSVRDGSPASGGAAATISGRWLYRYRNVTSGTYSNWDYMGPDSPNNAGEGWTMKGTHATSGTEQNYVFTGVPNNGPIDLNIFDGNDYLIGNPYASALDADTFLKDNTDLDGTLYFWEHWGGGSHILKEYQGGYATYNLSGGVGNATIGTAHPLVNSGGSPTKVPKRFIPIAQGFFVTGVSDGTIKFRNAQRAFRTEASGQSIFTSAPGSTASTEPNSKAAYDAGGDDRTKIRIGFDSPNLIHRQLLLTVDENASLDYDKGYDGRQYGEQFDDMSWKLAGKKYTIQGIDALESVDKLPLHVKLRDRGQITIKIDYAQNLDSQQSVYLYDSKEETYHDITKSDYTSDFLFPGNYPDRFYITFEKAATLSNDDVTDNDDRLIVYKPTSQNILKLENIGGASIQKVTLTNLLGQQVVTWPVESGSNEASLILPSVATGAYIVTVVTDQGKSAHKILIE
jgi:hypothetical protein